MRKIFISIILFVFLIGIAPIVQAESLVFTATPSTTTLNEGEEVTITFSVSSLDMGEDGINTFGGKLVYDEAIFEKVTASSFSGQNNWSVAYNDEETDKKGTFLASIMTGATTDQTIAVLKLKVKTKLKSTKAQIKLTELSSVGQDTVELSDKIIELNIKGTVKDEKPDDNKGNQQGNNTTNKNNGKKENILGNKDNTVSPNKIPQTGVQDTITVIVMIGLIVVATLVYVKFRKSKYEK